MRGLLFLGRVTFICNLFFVICLFLRHTHFTIPIAFNEFVIIVGWVLSVLLNFIFAIILVITLAAKKEAISSKWLAVANTFFFLFQIMYRLLFKF
jgi:hypothetical protein